MILNKLFHYISGKLSKFISSKTAKLMAVSVSTLCMTSCEYGPESLGCCNDSEFLSEAPDNFLDTYRGMCHATMTFDDKYGLNANCNLREVDHFIDEAMKCCASLKPTAASGYVTSYGYMDYYSHFDSSAVFIPSNAYARCLTHTHPRNYQCDPAEAEAFMNEMNACCEGATLGLDCEREFVSTNGEHCAALDEIAAQTCCASQPDEQDGETLSKATCTAYFLEHNLCVHTELQKCCFRAPENASSPKGIDRQTCTEIYQKTAGAQCVNTDEKYKYYNG